ncbi:FAD/NAD(P)-binding oxidoreductase [Iamia sp.]|uniref:NAD(P)/FAD-dependent oxidoreductase n=1 Tax=Iamia sp. TaxID=2722710 RepID=UPI002CF81246|nr:FAD/NAD(P)-binding oxidoreductase [Iamia sp.]HXH58740.1 FAD/NAD(P)-binding oxidoreductase [Iamia sp.]
MVGASLAGLNAARALRGGGFDGTLTIVGAEEHRPYDRPPLSKQVLAGTWDPERTTLAGTGDGELDVEWRLGSPADGLDVAGRTVSLADGSSVTYDGLVIATGAAPRTLPGVEGVAGVHVLRSLDDCLALKADLDAAPARVVVVGAGFIGAEVAATCRARGLAVTVVEPLPVPLGRVLGTEVGGTMAAVHRDHGVDLRLGVGVLGVVGAERVEGVRLTDATTLACEVVVVGIGVVPSTGWLEESGLSLADGVRADASCRVAPGIVAAGDVARWHHQGYGESLRVEHWDHAIAQGAHAAATLLAGDGAEPFTPVPWFWSDQYDRKIMVAGRTQGAEEVRVVEGSLEERRFVALYRRGGEVAAVLGMNRPAPLARWRLRLAEGVTWADAVAGCPPPAPGGAPGRGAPA